MGICFDFDREQYVISYQRGNIRKRSTTKDLVTANKTFKKFKEELANIPMAYKKQYKNAGKFSEKMSKIQKEIQEKNKVTSFKALCGLMIVRAGPGIRCKGAWTCDHYSDCLDRNNKALWQGWREI
jgi:hypothetical protein